MIEGVGSPVAVHEGTTMLGELSIDRQTSQTIVVDNFQSDATIGRSDPTPRQVTGEGTCEALFAEGQFDNATQRGG